MERINHITHKGRQIMYTDFSGLSVRDKELIFAIIEEAQNQVKTKSLNSLYMLTNVSGTSFDSDITNAFKQYAAHNKPYVKETVLVGVSGLQKVILKSVEVFTGRKFNLFDDVEQAKDWLAGK